MVDRNPLQEHGRTPGISSGGPSEMQQPARANVLGVGISAIDRQSAVELADELVRTGGKGYICVTGVHGVIEAQKNPEILKVLNQSFLTTPDGMPMVWVGKHQGLSIERVYGPDLMADLCERSVAHGYRHFLYGGNAGVAEELKQALEVRFPGIQISGTYTPPYRPLTPDERMELRNQVETAKAHIVWVGISTPKQELFMASSLGDLPVNLMIGVGAAFDIHTGRIEDAPEWMKRIGMQWAYRVIQDPRRLWRRYLVNNTLFVIKIAKQLLGVKKYPRPFHQA